MPLKNEYGDRVSNDIIGLTNQTLPPGIDRLGPPPNALRSYPGFVHWLSSVQPGWDIGLAPLLDTPFNACKSPIKAMDYAALGMVALVSDSPVYRGCLADGSAGQLVCNNPAAWYAALDRLVRDPDKRRTIAARGRATFLAEASLISHAEVRRNALLRLLAVRRSHAAA